MNKILLPLILLTASLGAYADSAEDNLMNAQAAYRATLRAQSSNDSKIIVLQSDLENARSRMQKAQADIARLESELQTATETKNRQAETLKQAGQRLDAAWNAVYGPGGTKARR